jgi:hypothetical protein
MGDPLSSDEDLSFVRQVLGEMDGAQGNEIRIRERSDRPSAPRSPTLLRRGSSKLMTPEIRQHRHRPATSATVHALGTCAPLEVAFCECGAFRIPQSTIWNCKRLTSRQPDSAKHLPALSEAAHRLGLSDRAMERLVAGGLIRGEKCCFTGKRRWLFTPQKLERLRFPIRLKRPRIRNWLVTVRIPGVFRAMVTEMVTGGTSRRTYFVRVMIEYGNYPAVGSAALGGFVMSVSAVAVNRFYYLP